MKIYQAVISISINIFYFCSTTTKTERNKQTYRTINIYIKSNKIKSNIVYIKSNKIK